MVWTSPLLDPESRLVSYSTDELTKDKLISFVYRCTSLFPFGDAQFMAKVIEANEKYVYAEVLSKEPKSNPLVRWITSTNQSYNTTFVRERMIFFEHSET